MLCGLAAAAVGIFVAFSLYKNVASNPLPAKLGGLATAMKNKFYFDEFYEATFLRAHAAARGVEIALGIGGQGPEIRRGGIEDLGEFGREKDAAVAAQRQILQCSAFEIGAVAMLPEVRFHGESGGEGGERHQEESNCFHWCCY